MAPVPIEAGAPNRILQLDSPTPTPHVFEPLSTSVSVNDTSAHSYSIIKDDSSDSGPFEGPEKLLELWFAPAPEDVPTADEGFGPRTEIPGVLEGEPARKNLVGLRRVERGVWEEMLDLVRCKVVSVIEGEEVDAYLLSESSMFVWPHKLILKTCGTTTLLLGIPALVAIAKKRCNLLGVWRCFYSRKTFMFPERQLGPHKGWNEEVKFLDNVFEKGSAYGVGKTNGDHWLLYITAPREDVLLSTALKSLPFPAEYSNGPERIPSSLPPARYTHRPPLPIPSRPDSTLEILMTGLSPRASGQFYAAPTSPSGSTAQPTRYPEEPSNGHAPGRRLAEDLGLADPELLGEEVVTDAFLFAPCGFSANLISAQGQDTGGRYATVHVTPEDGWSYASFECNIDFSGTDSSTQASGKSDLGRLVDKIVRIFEPSRLSLTLFVSQDEAVAKAEQDYGVELRHDGLRTALKKDLIKGYRRTDRILYEFEGYDLVFATFERL